jgi:predicted Fe-Mo cluster-binding NifX family protein
MRIAIPTNDGTSVSDHFGRSAAFLIFDIENGQITNRETRTNGSRHQHADGTCHQQAAGSQSHSHAGILATLSGCDTVICTGMGHRAAEALKAAGIKPVVVSSAGPAEEAVLAFLSGELSTKSVGFCRCRN